MNRLGFHFTLSELGGAFADVGTLLPFLVALIAINGLHPTPVLLLVGLAYIGTGLFYRLPIPVQPLKSVAAIAIALGSSPAVVSASGMVIGVVLIGFALSGLVRPISRLFPKAVVQGIQLGVGLLMVKVSYSLVSGRTVSPAAAASPPEMEQNFLLSLAAVGLLLFFLRIRRFPASIAVLGFGIGMGVFTGDWAARLSPPAFPSLALPHFDDLVAALLLLVLPQLPLTLGNSVFGTAEAAQTYYGAAAHRVTPRNLLLSVGVMGLLAGLLGAMPLCHGSGGVTAHYRLGARTGGANLMIGGFLTFLALFLGGKALPYLTLVPYPVLGVLLGFVGLQHALLARNTKGAHGIATVVLIGVATLYTGNLAIAFGFGIALHYLLRFVHHWSNRRLE